MSARVLISGHFNKEDEKYIEGTNKPNFIFYPKLQIILERGKEYVDLFLQEANRSDLVIFALFGSSLEAFFGTYLTHPEVEKLIVNSNIIKVLWSLDTHHDYGMEWKYQSLFDRYYVCGSNHLQKFKEVDTLWLPCCFYYMGIDTLRALLKEKSQNKRQIIFPYRIYNIGDRDLIAFKISRTLEKYNLHYTFGFVDYGMPYIQAIKESRICLNIHMAEGLNLRNFEAWAFNKVLLTSDDLDFSKISMDFSSTYLYKRDLSNFEEALDLALNNNAVSNTAQVVLNNHMVVHRYIDIINKELNTDFKIHGTNEIDRDRSSQISISNNQGVNYQPDDVEIFTPKSEIYFSSRIARIAKDINALVYEGKNEEAKSSLSKAMEGYQSAPDLLKLKAEIERRLGNENDSRLILEGIRQRFPFYPI